MDEASNLNEDIEMEDAINGDVRCVLLPSFKSMHLKGEGVAGKMLAWTIALPA